jgi:endo-1,3-1,4-beta-glycanase ExoK
MHIEHPDAKRKTPIVKQLTARGLALALCLSGSTGIALSQENTSFVDDFSTFDKSRWFASDGWVNGKWQNCTWSKRQVALSEGVPKLHFVKQPFKERDYSCGEVQSQKRYHYGTYEARIKTGSGVGLNGAFFTYIGKPQHDEIDFEVLLQDTSKITVNTFVAGKPKHGESIDVPGGTDGGFNDYAFVWEESRMRWYVNGKLAHEVSSDDMPANPQKIFVSLWGSDTMSEWLGTFKDPGAPVTLEVDRVAFTKLGEECQFPESVACSLD